MLTPLLLMWLAYLSYFVAVLIVRMQQVWRTPHV